VENIVDILSFHLSLLPQLKEITSFSFLRTQFCMFIGEYQVNTDEKGRISIPAKFRAQLKERLW